MFYHQSIDRHQSVGRDAANAVYPAAPNVTGIPDRMKARFEAASGMSFDDVRIHYNSARPAKLNALAYTQGTNVYLGAGQEKHLPHELGHVIQQKRGKVPVRRWLNGLPLNDDTRLEAEADCLSQCKDPVQAVGFPADIVQRKMDVEVALVPVEDRKQLFLPIDVMVDTVKLAGRADTGLANDEGRKSQGDHIIADVLVKKYQKVMCRGQRLPNIFNFYRNLTNEMQYENAIADRRIRKLPEEKRDPIQEERISSSNDTAEKISGIIAQGETEVKNIPGWRKHVKEIIRLYNIAYSNSYFATHGVGTGGHGEAEAMRYIRDEMSTDTIIRPCFTNKLIDRVSLNNALLDIGADENDLVRLRGIVQNRFSMMLEQMIFYRGLKKNLVRSDSMTEELRNESKERRSDKIVPLDQVAENGFNLLRYGLYYSPEEILGLAEPGRIQAYIEEHGYPADCPEEQIMMGLLQEKLGVSAIMDQHAEYEKCSRVYGYLSKIGGFLQEGSIYTRKAALNIMKLKSIKGQMEDLLSYCECNPTADSLLSNIYMEIRNVGTNLLVLIDEYFYPEPSAREQNVIQGDIIGILQWAVNGAGVCKSLCEQQKAAFDLRDI